MNAKVLLVLRIVFGLFLITFGLNKFLQFMPMGEMGEAAGNFFGALMSTKTLMLVAIVEIVAGLSLLLNKYAALMMLILMSISINAVLFHATLEPGSIPGAIILLVLNVVMLYAYKDKYKDLLNG
jgi:uncharacterized membrane protein YphA (DoxX/SURF4 family)